MFFVFPRMVVLLLFIKFKGKGAMRQKDLARQIKHKTHWDTMPGGEANQNDENLHPNIRESVKRKMELDMNDVASNCFFVSESELGQIVHNSGEGTDGLIIGFASNMKNIAALPESTFMHVSR